MIRGTAAAKRARKPAPDAVFVNCPFDASYRAMFEAIVFTVIVLDFDVRCALERDTGAEERLAKISRAIGECRFGIHDISFMRIDRKTRLPRYNMVFELGLFLGCRQYGGRRQEAKSCLILDRQRWRYRNSISDLSGRDIQAHGGNRQKAIGVVRDWLATESGLSELPGGRFVVDQYSRFRKELPRKCRDMKRKVSDLTFSDYCEMVRAWRSIDD
ncbi:conserved hypothetical protein [Candidatus Sulfopaludibacter sp. SbA4]|nr:conserved hypothetical protein [Candidatus Sulfopaludibacter sp. SbA4]